jgi:hypothetical protein
MSTRSQIGFYERVVKPEDLNNPEALIYRHSDGYPDGQYGVPQTITPILLDFDKNRGLNDLEYASAWLVAKLKTDYLNIGISKYFHADIEYYYAVTPDEFIAYECRFDFDGKYASDFYNRLTELFRISWKADNFQDQLEQLTNKE